MPSYETTIITRPEITEEQWSTLRTKLEKVIQSHKGQIAQIDDWGVKRLSYEIQKQNRGHYFHLTYLGAVSTVADVERNLGINEQVIRFLSVHLSKEDDLESLKQRSMLPKKPVRTNPNHDDYIDESAGIH